MSVALRPQTVRALRVVLVVAAGLGLLIGLGTLQLHLAADPLADVHAYYDAATRLNEGRPLYDQPATTDDADFYRYPPLLAIAWRPLALLPFDVAAAIWVTVLLAATVATVVLLLRDRPPFVVALALGMLAMPVLWTLAIGQAQALVTLLLATASPLGVALAGHLKLTPWLAAIAWLARGDRRALLRFAAWTLGLALVQLLLAPGDTIAYLSFSSLEQVGDVVNLSPWAVSPVLWAALVALLAVAAWRLARTGWGWAAAVTLAVGVTPRLLGYQLETLLAALVTPGRRTRT